MAAPRFVGPFPGGARLADSQRSAVTRKGAVDVGVKVLVQALVRSLGDPGLALRVVGRPSVFCWVLQAALNWKVTEVLFVSAEPAVCREVSLAVVSMGSADAQVRRREPGGLRLSLREPSGWALDVLFLSSGAHSPAVGRRRPCGLIDMARFRK